MNDDYNITKFKNDVKSSRFEESFKNFFTKPIVNLSESEKAKMGTRFNNFYRSLDDNWQCSKQGAELLENLMGEFTEFDSFLERTA